MTEAEKRLKRCCFTGHRPEKLKTSEKELKQGLARAIETALAAGKRTFITGMARGTDIYAGELVLQYRDRDPSIRLICAIPYPDFEKRWSTHWQQRYRAIEERADLVKVICSTFSMGSYQKRNEWMVDRSSMIIAVFNGESGGTKNTIDFARAHGIEVINSTIAPMVQRLQGP